MLQSGEQKGAKTASRGVGILDVVFLDQALEKGLGQILGRLLVVTRTSHKEVERTPVGAAQTLERFRRDRVGAATRRQHHAPVGRREQPGVLRQRLDSVAGRVHGGILAVPGPNWKPVLAEPSSFVTVACGVQCERSGADRTSKALPFQLWIWNSPGILAASRAGSVTVRICLTGSSRNSWTMPDGHSIRTASATVASPRPKWMRRSPRTFHVERSAFPSAISPVSPCPLYLCGSVPTMTVIERNEPQRYSERRGLVQIPLSCHNQELTPRGQLRIRNRPALASQKNLQFARPGKRIGAGIPLPFGGTGF